MAKKQYLVLGNFKGKNGFVKAGPELVEAEESDMAEPMKLGLVKDYEVVVKEKMTDLENRKKGHQLKIAELDKELEMLKPAMKPSKKEESKKA